MKRALVALVIVGCGSRTGVELTADQKAAFAAIDKQLTDDFAPGPSTELEAAVAAVEADPDADVVAPMSRWMAAKGGLPHAKPNEPRAIMQLHAVADALRHNPPLDDTRAEIMLYLAQRLRREGDSLLAVMIGVSIPQDVATAMPSPPAFAARYMPEEADVVRAFRVDTRWTRQRIAGQATDEGKEAIATQARLAGAPDTREGFIEHLADVGKEHPLARTWPTLAQDMYARVDAVRAWAMRPASSTAPR